MKFPIPTAAKVQTLHIKGLTGGLNFSENSEKDNGGLAYGKNLWVQNGVLKSRPGLYTTEDRTLNNTAYQGGYSYYYIPTDIEITVDGELKKMFAEEIDIDDSHHVMLTHFINSDGSHSSTAEIHFDRISDSVYYMPQTVSFFKGAPISGGGIYAFARLVNVENFTESWGQIYEITADLSEWVATPDTYIPTVLINGRGNNYEISAATNQAFTGTPTKLEALNILDGSFYAYFSSDGRSSSFRLPFAELADAPVSCRFYYGHDTFVEWVIPEYESSAAIKYGEVDVTMHVNRQTGIVYFTVPAGDYEVPLISHRNENNLRFCAVKNTTLGLKDITAATCAVSHNSKIILAANNLVFEADYSKPLYFPADSVCVIGDIDSPITALAPFKGSIAVFKKGEAHLLQIKEGKALNSVSLLSDNDSVFYKSDTLTAECVSYTAGCNAKNSIICLNGALLWRSTDGYIYSLKGSGEIVCLSRKINSFINGNITSTDTCVFEYNGYCIFVCENRALAMEIPANGNITPESVNWYYWEFPSELVFTGAFSSFGDLRLFCSNPQYELCFIASLEGDTDTCLLGAVSDLQTEIRPIKTALRTKKISLGCANVLKKLENVILRLKTKKSVIRINDRLEGRFCKHKGEDTFETVTLSPGLCGINELDISVEADAPLSLQEIDIRFTELGL